MKRGNMGYREIPEGGARAASLFSTFCALWAIFAAARPAAG